MNSKVEEPGEEEEKMTKIRECGEMGGKDEVWSERARLQERPIGRDKKANGAVEGQRGKGSSWETSASEVS